MDITKKLPGQKKDGVNGDDMNSDKITAIIRIMIMLTAIREISQHIQYHRNSVTNKNDSK